MMEPTTLAGLLAAPGVAIAPRGLQLAVPAEWIVPGEDRLSYATLIRLCECCREHHWQRDISMLAPTLDSIVVQCNASFRHPILAGAHVGVRYAITRVGDHSYDCAISITPLTDDAAEPYATVVLTIVFYDPTTHTALHPPPEVTNALRALIGSEQHQ